MCKLFSHVRSCVCWSHLLLDSTTAFENRKRVIFQIGGSAKPKRLLEKIARKSRRKSAVEKIGDQKKIAAKDWQVLRFLIA